MNVMGQYCTTKRVIALVVVLLLIGAICLFASGAFSSKSQAQAQTKSPPDPTKDILLVNLVGFLQKILCDINNVGNDQNI